jgi:hypothetical protein
MKAANITGWSSCFDFEKMELCKFFNGTFNDIVFKSVLIKFVIK